MPISLPPIDRRRFLKGLASIGAVASLPFSFLRAEETGKRDPDCFALLSDTHIPADRTTVTRDVNPVDNFRAITKEVISSPDLPAAMIVSGDCVHLHGKPEDYKTLIEELSPTREAGIAVHLVMGNHDERDAFLEACDWARPRKDDRPVPKKQVSVIESPKANWFLLDSLIRPNYTPGKFGTEMLEWLGKELDKRKDKPAVLVAHHNLENDDNEDSNGLVDSGAFWKTIIGRPQVKAYVYGHTHVWKTQVRKGVHLVNIPATAWKFLSSEPTAWVCAKLREDGMSLHLRSLHASHRHHGQRLELNWRS